MRLQDHRGTLFDQSINSDSVLYLEAEFRGKMKITSETFPAKAFPLGNKVYLEVENSNTINILKAKVQDVEDISADLFLPQKAAPLADYCILNEFPLHVVQTPGSTQGGLNLNDEAGVSGEEVREVRPIGRDRAKKKASPSSRSESPFVDAGGGLVELDLMRGLMDFLECERPTRLSGSILSYITKSSSYPLIAQSRRCLHKDVSIVVGMLERVDMNVKAPHVMCICPTDAFALEVVIDTLDFYPVDVQVHDLWTWNSVHVMVFKGKLQTSNIKMVVVDELDYSLAQNEHGLTMVQQFKVLLPAAADVSNPFDVKIDNKNRNEKAVFDALFYNDWDVSSSSLARDIEKSECLSDESRQNHILSVATLFLLINTIKMLQSLEKSTLKQLRSTPLSLTGRGVTTTTINTFVRGIGITRRLSFDTHVRDELNKTTSRTMVVLHPLKVVITNHEASLVVDLDAKKWPNAPNDDASSHYKVPFSNVVYIEQTDFRLKDSKDYKGLAPGKTLLLKYAFLIKCTEVVLSEDTTTVVEIHVEYDPHKKTIPKASQSQTEIGVGKLHWVASPRLQIVDKMLKDDIFNGYAAVCDEQCNYHGEVSDSGCFHVASSNGGSESAENDDEHDEFPFIGRALRLVFLILQNVYMKPLRRVGEPLLLVGSTARTDNNAASSMMQKFWDSAMAAPPADDDSEPGSESYFDMASEAETDIGRSLEYFGMLRNRKAASAATGVLEQAHLDAAVEAALVVGLRIKTLMRARCMRLSLPAKSRTSNWLERLPAGSITTWEDLTTRFLAQFFPPGRTAKLRMDSFQGLTTKSPSSWHRPLAPTRKSSQCLMEAHLAPTQPTQVNKINTSCEICSGPHDTQYCMEDPEQAFFEYASSRTDEAGDARLSKFEADFKQQQSEMTNKIDTVLKAITNRIAGTLPSDTVKNPKLRTYPSLSARSYPTEDPQCSTQTHEEDSDVMFIEVIPKDDNSSKEEPKADGQEVEYFDIFLTRSELAYHKYLMCGPMPLIFLRNPNLMEGCPSNLKIPCNIGHVHVIFDEKKLGNS
ncbi:MAK10-like protein [Tanacetum coccineum]|uniref:MAK10-like protein n=1 Tax=Tanacetum coccineum TaxID=301880 RepID=A0ABQ5DC15_9ASTR